MFHIIDYSVNKPQTMNVDEVYAFITYRDSDHEPRLSSRVDLFEYAAKLVNNAYIFVARDSGKIVGIMAIYYNPYPEYSYSTYISVDPDYQKDDMVGLELENMLKIFWKTHKTKGVRFGIRKANKQLVNYHLRMGAIIISEEFFPGTDKIELHMQKDFNN